MIRVVTDSNSQLPASVAERYGISIVPLTVTLDGVEYLEGVDLDVDHFYARLAEGTSAVGTAQPSPGRFAAVCQGLAQEGASEIVSVHIGASVSGTVNSARLAAEGVDVPVRIVDTGQASFGVALAAWAAGEAVQRGASSDEAADVALSTAGTVGNVFAVRTLELARAGGRLEARARALEGARIPVMTMRNGVMHVVGEAADLEEVAGVMAAHVRSGGRDLRVGIGVADAELAGVWSAVEELLAGAERIRELVRYRVGPSVGAHTGPGTVGVMFAPAPPISGRQVPPRARPAAC